MYGPACLSPVVAQRTKLLKIGKSLGEMRANPISALLVQHQADPPDSWVELEVDPLMSYSHHWLGRKHRFGPALVSDPATSDDFKYRRLYFPAGDSPHLAETLRLISQAGECVGKWTACREISEDTLDLACDADRGRVPYTSSWLSLLFDLFTDKNVRVRSVSLRRLDGFYAICPDIGPASAAAINMIAGSGWTGVATFRSAVESYRERGFDPRTLLRWLVSELREGWPAFDILGMDDPGDELNLVEEIADAAGIFVSAPAITVPVRGQWNSEAAKQELKVARGQFREFLDNVAKQLCEAQRESGVVGNGEASADEGTPPITEKEFPSADQSPENDNRGKRWRVDDIDSAMKKIIADHKNPTELLGWPQRRWGKEIGCPASSVGNTKTWRYLQQVKKDDRDALSKTAREIQLDEVRNLEVDFR